MILISHRGNIDGQNSSKENTLDYIIEAINEGFDVEIDIYYKKDTFYLGHDYPKYKINLIDIAPYKNKLWIHCKNIDALFYLKDDYHCFFHDADDVVLTSKNFMWTYSGKPLTSKSIAVMPEKHYSDIQLYNCIGICSDYIKKYVI